LASLNAGTGTVIVASSSPESATQAVDRLRQDSFSIGKVKGAAFDAKGITSIRSVVKNQGPIDHLVFTVGQYGGRSFGTSLRDLDMEEVKGTHSPPTLPPIEALSWQIYQVGDCWCCVTGLPSRPVSHWVDLSLSPVASIERRSFPQ
jgi:hypothetical protein